MKSISFSFIITSILLGLQSVSHSQYYSLRESEESESTDHYRHFSDRAFQPSYRQHHHNHNQFYNRPGIGGEESYYGTVRDNFPSETTENNAFHHHEHHPVQAPSISAYRRYPVRTQYPEFTTVNVPGIKVSVGEDFGGTTVIRTPFSVRGNERRPTNVRPRPPEKHIAAGDSTLERPRDTLPICKPRHRIHRKDGKCYHEGLAGSQCGTWMIFYPEAENSIFGDCDCDLNNGIVSRPLIYWPPNERCYLKFHRGPCLYHEWLILDANGIARCAPRRCPHDSDEAEDSHEFWFRYRGKCYKTGQHYSALCSTGKEDWKVYFPPNSTEPECLPAEPNPFGRTLITTVNDLRCRPGFKKTQNGECKRVARYDNDYDY